MISHDSLFSNPMMSNCKTPMLICPSCEKTPFSLRLNQAETQMNILITCPCREEDTQLNLHQYIEKLYNSQVQDIHKCHKHIAKNAIKYCYFCAEWLCQECIIIHLQFKELRKEHILIDYAVINKCKEHKKPYLRYCQKCSVNICETCCPNHKDHQMIPLVLQEDQLDCFNISMSNVELSVLNLINRIDSEINKLTQMKKDIQCAYNVSKGFNDINQDLIVLYRSICRTQLTSTILLLQSIKINDKFSIEDLPIEKEYTRLQNYLKEYYVWKQTNVCTAQLDGHDDNVNCLVVSNDGTLISGSSDRTIRLWNTTTKVCTATLEGHENSVNCLVLLNDGTLASGSSDHKIKLWNTLSKVCTFTLKKHGNSVNCLVVLNDGTLASGSSDGTIKLWNASSRVCTFSLKIYEDSVTCLILLNDGRLASGSSDHNIKLWKKLDEKGIVTLIGHNSHVFCLVVLNDGTLASGSADNTIRLWNTSTNVCTSILTGYTSYVNCLVILNDGTLVSGFEDSMIRLWNTTTNGCICTLTGHNKSVNCLVILNNGALASGSSDKSIRLWEVL